MIENVEKIDKWDVQKYGEYKQEVNEEVHELQSSYLILSLLDWDTKRASIIDLMKWLSSVANELVNFHLFAFFLSFTQFLYLVLDLFIF